MNPIEFEIKFEEKDLYDYYIWHTYILNHKGTVTWVPGYYLVAMGFIGILVSLATYDFKSIIGGLFLCVVGLLGVFANPLIIKWKIKSNYSNDASVKQTQKYQISESGIKVTSESGDGVAGWEEICGVYQSKSAIILKESIRFRAKKKSNLQ